MKIEVTKEELEEIKQAFGAKSDPFHRACKKVDELLKRFPKERFKKDELLAVSLYEDFSTPALRYFSHMKDGKIYCFNGGDANIRTDGVIPWPYAKQITIFEPHDGGEMPERFKGKMLNFKLRNGRISWNYAEHRPWVWNNSGSDIMGYEVVK